MEIRELPFASLGGLYEQDDIDAVLAVVRAVAERGGDFFPLPEENDFQIAFARHEGARRASVVNSCGSALDLCMMALGIGPGDEVITTPLTFVATATCVVGRGAEVVFADVDQSTLCLDPDEVRKRITSRTSAIIPVHFAGLAADIDAFDSISSETGIPVIYDAAHAVSTKYKGAPIGARGKASCYSFQGNKNLTTLGEGGAVTTDDESFAETVRQKKTFGYIYGPKLRISNIGFNYRMTKPQCAVGLTQIAKVDRVVADRLRVFQYMNSLLEGIEEIIQPTGIQTGHACHLYVARLNTQKIAFSREALLSILRNKFKVGCGIHYPAVWDWEALARLGHSKQNARCPIAAMACTQVFSLPLFPKTTESDCDYISWAMKEAIAEARRTA